MIYNPVNNFVLISISLHTYILVWKLRFYVFVHIVILYVSTVNFREINTCFTWENSRIAKFIFCLNLSLTCHHYKSRNILKLSCNCSFWWLYISLFFLFYKISWMTNWVLPLSNRANTITSNFLFAFSCFWENALKYILKYHVTALFAGYISICVFVL